MQPYIANTKNTDAIECANSVLMCWKTTKAAKMLLRRRKMRFVGPVTPSNFKSLLKKCLLLVKTRKSAFRCLPLATRRQANLNKFK